MAKVRINSGPVDATDYIHETPMAKWPELVRARRDFVEVKINYDCRCLVQFVKDAEAMWKELGYSSAKDLIARGYNLEPEEVDLAVRWLELNQPEEVIGLREVIEETRKEATIRKAKENQQPALPHGGDRSKVINSENITLLDGQRGTSASYRISRLRRDHPTIAARLDAGEFDSVAAAERVARGEPANPPRKVTPPIEKVKKLGVLLSPEERQELIRWLADLK